MREYNYLYGEKNDLSVKEPLFTLEIDFSGVGTDLWYFTSSTSAQHPGGANVIDSCIKVLSTSSQKLDVFNFNSTIGGLNFSFIDEGGAVSDLLATKLSAGDGIRYKPCKLYKGFPGLDWTQYEPRGSRVITGLDTPDNLHNFTVSDAQRLVKQDIFNLNTTTLTSTLEEPRRVLLDGLHNDVVTTINVTTTNVKTNSTTLSADINASATTISVGSTDNFNTTGTIIIGSEHITYSGKTATSFTGCVRGVEGSSAASHNSGVTVHNTNPFPTSGYILIDAEVIQYTGKTYNTFTGCTRGAKGTTASSHVDNSNVYESMMTVFALSAADFELLEHDDNYSDSPNEEVGYIKVGDEIIKYHGKTSTTFIDCIRGALNTTPKKHEVKQNAKNPKIEEYVYIETTLGKVLYGLLLGALYGQSGKTFPSNWHLDIDPIWVRASDFTDLPDSIWDISDNSGHIVRIMGEKKQDGKKFIQSQLLPQIGFFLNIYAEGDMGLKPTVNIVGEAPYSELLSTSNVVGMTSPLKYNHDKVANKYIINWHYSHLQEKTIRQTIYVDPVSLNTHNKAKPVEIEIRSLHGNIHSDSTINTICDRFRDRMASPPKTFSLKLQPSMDYLEVGDVVYVILPQYRDHTTTSKTIRGAYQITSISINEVTGDVIVDLEGSSALPGAINQIVTETNVLYSNDTTLTSGIGSGDTTIPVADTTGFPDSGAVEINSESITFTGITATSLTGCSRGQHGTTAAAHSNGSGVHNSYYTDQGGINIKSLASYSAGSINAETLTGAADIFNAVYYHIGDLEINTGQTVSISLNVQVQVEGLFTISGAIDGAGNGYSGALAPIPILSSDHADGTLGFGRVISGGNIFRYDGYLIGTSTAYRNSDGFDGYPPNYYETIGYRDDDLVIGAYTFPGKTIRGLRNILAGTSGCSSYPSEYRGSTTTDDDNILYQGNDGGASGAGLRVICQGMTFNPSSTGIDTSGSDGSIARTTAGAGAGAGGYAGGVHVVLDGTNSVVPDLNTYHTSKIGATPLQAANTYIYPGKLTNVSNLPSPYASGLYSRSAEQVQAYQISYIPSPVDSQPEDDEQKPQPITNLKAESGTSALLTLKGRVVIPRIKLTWTPSEDRKGDYYEILYREEGGKYITIDDKPSRTESEAYITNVKEGVEYECLVRLINVWGETSEFVTIRETVVGKTELPNDISSVTLTQIEGGARLSWTNPADRDLGYIWIYKNTINSIPPTPDFIIGAGTSGESQSYDILEDNGVTIYAWARCVDTTDNLSNIVASSPTNMIAGDYTYSDSTSISTLQPAEPGSQVNAQGFKESFEVSNSLEQWVNYSGDGELSIVSVTYSLSGGKILRAGNNSGNDQVWLIHTKNIPFDPTKLYKLTARIRRTGGTGVVYAGWAGVADDGTTLVNINGIDSHTSQHYHCASNRAPGTGWALYTGYTSGYGATVGTAAEGTISVQGEMHPDVRYIRPLLLLNSNSVAGVMEVDSFIVEELAANYNEITTQAIDEGINTTGKIENTGLAAIEMGTSGVNPSVWVNTATWQSNGIQLQYNSGTPRAYVGDGDERYLQYDGTTLSVGPDVHFEGADSIGGNAIFYHSELATVDNIRNTYAFGEYSPIWVRNTSDDAPMLFGAKIETSYTYSYFQVARYYNSNFGYRSVTWDKPRRTILYCALGDSAVTDMYTRIGAGLIRSASPSTAPQISFEFRGKVMYASSGNGTNGQVNSLGITLSGGVTPYKLEIRHYPASKIEWYVDDVLKYTQTNTSYIPTGSSYNMLWGIATWSITSTKGNTGTSVYIQDIYVNQHD